MLGDWQGCTSCTFRCENTRSVKCVRPVGHSEQDVDIIADSYCEGPKPKEREPCAGREKRSNDNIPTTRSKRWQSMFIILFYLYRALEKLEESLFKKISMKTIILLFFLAKFFHFVIYQRLLLSRYPFIKCFVIVETIRRFGRKEITN